MAAYGTIVIVGGGCYGSYYLRQLFRAHRAGALTWRRVLVVDHKSDCAITTSPEMNSGADMPLVELVTAEWKEFFADYLSRWESEADRSLADAIVPSPLMPHLMYDWIRDRATERWPDRNVETRPIQGPAGTPWEREAPDGTRYVSFAEWICPVNCIEPDVCPHTRGPRSWTMPQAVREYVEARRAVGEKIRDPLVFHCTHRAYGVGMIDTAAVVAADSAVAAAAIDGPATFLVGTVSHCHGALNLLSVS